MHNTNKTYHEILGVSQDASTAEVRKAYRRLVKTCHPDVSTNPNAAEITRQINAAYDVLSDSSKRLAYEYDLRDRQGATSPEATPASPWIYCQGCGAVNSSLKVVGFYSVIGVLLGMWRGVRGGVMCRDCRSRIAFRQNMITAICGWWGIPSFFFAWHALLKNLTGGIQPPDANEQLRQALKQQDVYFSSKAVSPSDTRVAHAIRITIPSLLSVGAMALLCTWSSGSEPSNVVGASTAAPPPTRLSSKAAALENESFTRGMGHTRERLNSLVDSLYAICADGVALCLESGVPMDEIQSTMEITAIACSVKFGWGTEESVNCVSNNLYDKAVDFMCARLMIRFADAANKSRRPMTAPHRIPQLDSLFVGLRKYGVTEERMDQAWNAAVRTGQFEYFRENRLWYVAHSDNPQTAQFIENWTGGSMLDEYPVRSRAR